MPFARSLGIPIEQPYFTGRTNITQPQANTGSSSAINNSTGYAIGATSIIVDDSSVFADPADADVGDITRKSYVRIDGDHIYEISSINNSSNTITLASGLVAAVADDAPVAQTFPGLEIRTETGIGEVHGTYSDGIGENGIFTPPGLWFRSTGNGILRFGQNTSATRAITGPYNNATIYIGQPATTIRTYTGTIAVAAGVTSIDLPVKVLSINSLNLDSTDVSGASDHTLSPGGRHLTLTSNTNATTVNLTYSFESDDPSEALPGETGCNWVLDDNGEVVPARTTLYLQDTFARPFGLDSQSTPLVVGAGSKVIFIGVKFLLQAQRDFNSDLANLNAFYPNGQDKSNNATNANVRFYSCSIDLEQPHWSNEENDNNCRVKFFGPNIVANGLDINYGSIDTFSFETNRQGFPGTFDNVRLIDSFTENRDYNDRNFVVGTDATTIDLEIEGLAARNACFFSTNATASSVLTLKNPVYNITKPPTNTFSVSRGTIVVDRTLNIPLTTEGSSDNDVQVTAIRHAGVTNETRYTVALGTGTGTFPLRDGGSLDVSASSSFTNTYNTVIDHSTASNTGGTFSDDFLQYTCLHSTGDWDLEFRNHYSFFFTKWGYRSASITDYYLGGEVDTVAKFEGDTEVNGSLYFGFSDTNARTQYSTNGITLTAQNLAEDLIISRTSITETQAGAYTTIANTDQLAAALAYFSIHQENGNGLNTGDFLYTDTSATEMALVNYSGTNKRDIFFAQTAQADITDVEEAPTSALGYVYSGTNEGTIEINSGASITRPTGGVGRITNVGTVNFNHAVAIDCGIDADDYVNLKTFTASQSDPGSNYSLIDCNFPSGATITVDTPGASSDPTYLVLYNCTGTNVDINKGAGHADNKVIVQLAGDNTPTVDDADPDVDVQAAITITANGLSAFAGTETSAVWDHDASPAQTTLTVDSTTGFLERGTGYVFNGNSEWMTFTYNGTTATELQNVTFPAGADFGGRDIPINSKVHNGIGCFSVFPGTGVSPDPLVDVHGGTQHYDVDISTGAVTIDIDSSISGLAGTNRQIIWSGYGGEDFVSAATLNFEGTQSHSVTLTNGNVPASSVEIPSVVTTSIALNASGFVVCSISGSRAEGNNANNLNAAQTWLLLESRVKGTPAYNEMIRQNTTANINSISNNNIFAEINAGEVRFSPGEDHNQSLGYIRIKDAPESANVPNAAGNDVSIAKDAPGISAATVAAGVDESNAATATDVINARNVVLGNL